MKRDKALMLNILQALSTFITSYGDVEKIQSSLEVKNTPPELILHHLRLLHDRGLVAVDIHQFWRLTDQGYDILEAGDDLSSTSLPEAKMKVHSFDN